VLEDATIFTAPVFDDPSIFIKDEKKESIQDEWVFDEPSVIAPIIGESNTQKQHPTPMGWTFDEPETEPAELGSIESRDEQSEVMIDASSSGSDDLTGPQKEAQEKMFEELNKKAAIQPLNLKSAKSNRFETALKKLTRAPELKKKSVGISKILSIIPRSDEEAQSTHSTKLAELGFTEGELDMGHDVCTLEDTTEIGSMGKVSIIELARSMIDKNRKKTFDEMESRYYKRSSKGKLAEFSIKKLLTKEAVMDKGNSRGLIYEYQGLQIIFDLNHNISYRNFSEMNFIYSLKAQFFLQEFSERITA
jgi:hypothetical protein